MHWLLVLIIVYDIHTQPVVHEISFSSKDLCETAGKAILESRIPLSKEPFDAFGDTYFATGIQYACVQQS